MRDDFCIFILTHGRPNQVSTFEKVMSQRYSGRVYIVIDDEDRTAAIYRRNFGQRVLVFSKTEIATQFDEGDNFQDRRSVVYARNACFQLARQVGATYFMEMDDDYGGFSVRFSETDYGEWKVPNLDTVFTWMLEYFEAIPALSIAMSQGGDHIGGHVGDFSKRKAMNSWLCSVNRPFKFVGRMNDDVNTYVTLGQVGGLFLTIPVIKLQHKPTQSLSGGMTEFYLNTGTYVKSFYSVMYAPSSVKIGTLGPEHVRIHHSIDWRSAVPQIINDRYRKA